MNSLITIVAVLCESIALVSFTIYQFSFPFFKLIALMK